MRFNFPKEVQDMGAKVGGSPARYDLEEKSMEIGLENAPRDAAPGAHQFNHVLGER